MKRRKEIKAQWVSASPLGMVKNSFVLPLRIALLIGELVNGIRSVTDLLETFG